MLKGKFLRFTVLWTLQNIALEFGLDRTVVSSLQMTLSQNSAGFSKLFLAKSILFNLLISESNGFFLVSHAQVNVLFIFLFLEVFSRPLHISENQGLASAALSKYINTANLIRSNGYEGSSVADKLEKVIAGDFDFC